MAFGSSSAPSASRMTAATNIAVILFTLRQDRIVAVVQMHGQNTVPTTMMIGQMTNDEFACIRRLTDDYQLAVC